MDDRDETIKKLTAELDRLKALQVEAAQKITQMYAFCEAAEERAAELERELGRKKKPLPGKGEG